MSIDEKFLTTIEENLPGRIYPGPSELTRILKYCQHPLKRVRERALNLIFHPPVSDENSYHRWLYSRLWSSTNLLRLCPKPILEELCEWISCGLLPFDKVQNPSQRLKILSRNLGRRLFSKPLRITCFLPFLHIKYLLYHRNCKKVRDYYRHWRYLRKRLLKAEALEGWEQLTLADLEALYYRKRAPKKFPWSKARWLIAGRSLLSPKMKKSHETFPILKQLPSPRYCYWGGFGYIQRVYLEALLNKVADELRFIRELAIAVSTKTRRVVLSWHNATLAGCGGWAFESLQDQFPGEDLWSAFKTRVKANTFRGVSSECVKQLEELWGLWEKRLIIPRLEYGLWEETVFRGNSITIRKPHPAIAALLSPELMETWKNYSLPTALNPSQRLSLEKLLRWRDWRQRNWKQGWLCLRTLILEGQKLMDTGKLNSLVLPLIDKFFISSKREKDIEYLARLVNWLRKYTTFPVILFWEDTIHKSEPSLKIALKLRSDLSWHGFGVFGSGSNEDALNTIIKNHDKTSLFVLHPNPKHYNPKSFQELLDSCDGNFLRQYDSAWKDNTVCLYSGTQIFFLLGVQTDPESLPSWIVADHVRLPFGAYVRCFLKQKLLDVRSRFEPVDNLSCYYKKWAGLS